MEKTIAEELNEKFVPIDYSGEERISMSKVISMSEVQQEKPGIDLAILKAKTGEGSVGNYLEHPLNFNSSMGMARVLRGLTGMLGSLDLAVIDIFVGVLDLLKTNKKGVVDNGLPGKYGGIS